MIRRPLSPALMSAAIAAHDPEPARAGLLAHAMLDDDRLDRIAKLDLGPTAGALRDLLLDEEMRAVARCAGLACAAALWPPTQERAIVELAEYVDGMGVAELASVSPFEGMVSIADPKAADRRLRLASRRREERRDVLPPQRGAA